MAETFNGMRYADMIRMIAKSIYDDADDIAGKTEGCTEIEISFDIETGNYMEFPTYTVTRRHYPRMKLIDEFLNKSKETSETEEKRPGQVTLSHEDALELLGKCCVTCKYGNDIENPICDGCIHGDHVYDRETTDCWEDY